MLIDIYINNNVLVQFPSSDKELGYSEFLDKYKNSEFGAVGKDVIYKKITGKEPILTIKKSKNEIEKGN
jgi:hypothetical protein